MILLKKIMQNIFNANLNYIYYQIQWKQNKYVIFVINNIVIIVD